MVLPASSLRKFASSPKLNFPANIATPSHLNQHSHTSVYNLGGNKPLSRATSKATSMMNLKATSMVNLKVKDRSRFLFELGMKSSGNHHFSTLVIARPKLLSPTASKIAEY